MKRIRIAICDDDSIGRGLLQESLEYLLQENNLQAEISSYSSGPMSFSLSIEPVS